ncbi:ribosomal protein rpl14 [Capsaspora owczarzaki ATCC 30864]|uniref:Ribosomal protein rpl14 n=1 Tax=Capsaspora owczarzaki (strain ATCC 30864) TaxID=595528 RepID=A0A0D2VMF2_CAPO3|nr:ribosomal protein rpl14 [Capsaspora owczarzaki ATCC 30864]KJE91337.1 ribosomal protein rpl14 [Capsaspora owczarzaki ATCC 30864]|eukprot:XP_004349239.1 ribosomal protein rpl14 [Capsaspora owczarzaki ATCC 30864]
MVYTRFVQVGRVALATDGPAKGKLVVIVDIIDQTRALVDNPAQGVDRQSLSFSAMQLTDFTVGIPHGVGSAPLRRAYAKAEVETKWNQTNWAKTIARRATRASLTDFDRFKVMVGRKERSKIVSTAFNKLRRPVSAANKAKKAGSKKAAPKK